MTAAVRTDHDAAELRARAKVAVTRGMGKILRSLGFSRISARPPPGRPRAASRVQKKLPELIAAAVGEKGRGKRLEI